MGVFEVIFIVFALIERVPSYKTFRQVLPEKNIQTRFTGLGFRNITDGVIVKSVSSYSEFFPARDGYFYILKYHERDLQTCRSMCEDTYSCHLAIAQTKTQLEIFMEIGDFVPSRSDKPSMRIDLTSSDGFPQWGDSNSLLGALDKNILNLQSEGEASYVIEKGTSKAVSPEETYGCICSCNLMELEKPLE